MPLPLFAIHRMRDEPGRRAPRPRPTDEHHISHRGLSFHEQRDPSCSRIASPTADGGSSGRQAHHTSVRPPYLRVAAHVATRTPTRRPFGGNRRLRGCRILCGSWRAARGCIRPFRVLSTGRRLRPALHGMSADDCGRARTSCVGLRLWGSWSRWHLPGGLGQKTFRLWSHRPVAGRNA